ncbi:MAG: hypothetical protein IPO77_18380 [Acidobacteria bacterium]|nr:hypothetical protein [Acidobacteriota bacterium]
MKKYLTLAAAFVALAIFIGLGAAKAQDQKPLPPPQGAPATLKCCECLGQTSTLDLSTGQGSPIDPLWKLNVTAPAYKTPPVSSWVSLAPASWIQPVASPAPSNSVPPGIYKYSVKFNIPKCTIPSVVRLDGKFAADNSAQVFFDGPNLVASCPGPTCFKTPGVNFSVPSALLTPGNHTLTIDVKNDSSYSGLIVNAKLTRQCVREGN